MASPSLSKEHWRKSNQWFALTAPHAQLVLADSTVAEAFSKCVLSPQSCRKRRVSARLGICGAA